MKTLTFLLLASFLPAVAYAQTDIPANEQVLLASCRTLSDNPKQEAATLCNYYVQGYIGGTSINDTKNAT